MGVSGEGAALRSARTWLLLLCPEIPDRSGGKGRIGCGYSLRRQGTWAGRKGAMAWRMALLGSNMASLGHTSGETHKGGSKGPFSYLNWRLCTGSCSAGSTRPDAGLRPPSIAAFGRSLPSAAVDRGSRPSAAAADRGIEIDVATADPCRMRLIKKMR